MKGKQSTPHMPQKSSNENEVRACAMQLDNLYSDVLEESAPGIYNTPNQPISRSYEEIQCGRVSTEHSYEIMNGYENSATGTYELAGTDGQYEVPITAHYAQQNVYEVPTVATR